MGTIIVRPAPQASGSNLEVQDNGVAVVQDALILNFSGSFTITQAGQTAQVALSGSGQPGSVMYSVDGGAPTMELPLTGDAGWLVNDSGTLLIVG